MQALSTETLTPEVLLLKLSRPKQLNALNTQLLDDLETIFKDVQQNDNVKGLIITGEGNAFCAGADINEIAALNGITALNFAKRGQCVFNLLETLGKPSIAAINGYAMGGGCELAMAATLRIAADTALFAQPEIKLGLIPGYGGTQRLARLIGKGRALDLCLSGRTLNASTAETWGLVNTICPPSDLLTKATQVLQHIIKMPAVAIHSLLTTIHLGYDLSLTEALELEANQFALCATTEDKTIGVNAFLDKTTPTFKGK